MRDVELTDLLGRDAVPLDMDKTSGYVTGRIILVTGAGGSIGSEIVCQLACFNPGHIVLLGRGENSLFQLKRELELSYPELAYTTVVADVRDRRELKHLFETHHPEVIFHAPAHKHVPLMELNVDKAVSTMWEGRKPLSSSRWNTMSADS